uniref:Uncharacterized protein n=1 Tax=Catharus ustulatus TaxID=91951 RepID=A0A8C3UVS5_CATUS
MDILGGPRYILGIPGDILGDLRNILGVPHPLPCPPQGWWVLPDSQGLNLWYDCAPQNRSQGWECSSLGLSREWGVLGGSWGVLGGPGGG